MADSASNTTTPSNPKTPEQILTDAITNIKHLQEILGIAVKNEELIFKGHEATRNIRRLQSALGFKVTAAPEPPVYKVKDIRGCKYCVSEALFLLGKRERRGGEVLNKEEDEEELAKAAGWVWAVAGALVETRHRSAEYYSTMAGYRYGSA